MNVMKIALLGTAALAVASVSARADSLEALKASMNDLTIGAVADAPAAAAPATTVVWEGRVRVGVGAVYDPRGQAGATALNPGVGVAPAAQYAADIRTVGRIAVTGTTQTAVGEVGVTVALQGSAGSNTSGIANGANYTVGTDGVAGYWKMTPALTLTGGQLGGLVTAYSWDAIASNYFYARTGGGVLAFKSSPDDPAGLRLSYADGPLGFGVQVYDGANQNNVSAFGVNARASYKLDAIGFDFGGSYNGQPAGPAAYSVFGGIGYSAGAFGLGASLATGYNGTANTTPGSIYAKLGLSDVARLEIGALRDFQLAGNPTTIGAGLYYSPVKQLTFGIEGSYISSGLGAVGQDGSYAAGLVSAFSF